jgi:flagellar hook-length control protein FliK
MVQAPVPKPVRGSGELGQSSAQELAVGSRGKEEKGVKPEFNFLENAGTASISSAATAAAATAAAKAKQQIEFQDPKKQIELRNDFRSNGVMTDVLGAGPTQPWNSNWVFGENLPEAQGKALAAGETSFKNQKVSPGSDEKNIRIDSQAIESKIAQIQGLMEAMAVGEETPVETQQTRGAQLLSGEEYLRTMVGDRAERTEAGVNTRKSGQSAEALAVPNLFGAMNGPSEFGTTTASKAHGGETKLRSIPGGQSGLAKGQMTAGEDGLLEGASLGKENANSLSTLSTQDPAQRLPSFETIPLSSTHQSLDQLKTSGMLAAPVLTGNVIPGSMMKERLASESVINLSNQISSFAPKGGGEMRIRLNPDNLGELLIRVTTSGKDVGLKVQATRGEAKKILEESVMSLKDALSAQNLSLSRVDFTVAPQIAQQPSTGMSADTRSDPQNSFSNQGRESSANESRDDNRNNVRSFQNAQAAFSRAPRGSSGASGRLDVTA